MTNDHVMDAYRELVGCCTLIVHERVTELPDYLNGRTHAELQLLVVAAASTMVAFAERACQGSYFYDGTVEDWLADYGRNIARRTNEWPET